MGDGKRERPKHVNSGASHNWKINEHYFTKGEMTVEILHDDLTKSEALAIEQMLIKKALELVYGMSETTSHLQATLIEAFR